METNSSIIFFSLRLSSRRSCNKNTVFNRIRTKRLCFAIIWCHYQSLLKINIIIRDWILSARHLHRSACHFTPLGIFLKNLKMIIKGWRCCSHHLDKAAQTMLLDPSQAKVWILFIFGIWWVFIGLQERKSLAFITCNFNCNFICGRICLFWSLLRIKVRI